MLARFHEQICSLLKTQNSFQMLLLLAPWSLSMRAYLGSDTVKMRLIDASFRAASPVPAREMH